MLTSHLPYILLLAAVTAYRLGVFDFLFAAAKSKTKSPTVAEIEDELHALLNKYLEAKSKQADLPDLLRKLLDGKAPDLKN